VSFPPAVSESALVETAAKADVGLIPYNPAYFGYRYCCPNKLSQYLAAGLPIVSSSTEYVADIVSREKIGHVVDISNPIAFAGLIDTLCHRRQELVHMGRRARQFFEDRYHWEAVVTPLLSRIEDALQEQRRRTSRIDLDWMAEAAARHQRHGQAGALSLSMFGAVAATQPNSNSRADLGSGSRKGRPGSSEGVASGEAEAIDFQANSGQSKWPRCLWRLIPTKLRYALVDWLRRHVS
jgi:hypothetical protein